MSPEGKKPFGRSRLMWSIKMDLKVVGCGGMDWIQLAQSKHDNEPTGCIKGREFLDQLSDYLLLKKNSSPQS
jgi:hypothetical protein